MATNVTMPKLGLSMETGKINEWKVEEGGEIKEGEILLIVETEKITYEVESPATGLLHIIVPAEDEVPVAELIAVIGAEVAADLQETMFDWLDAPVARVAAPFTHIAFQPALEKEYFPNADKLVAKVKEIMG